VPEGEVIFRDLQIAPQCNKRHWIPACVGIQCFYIGK